MRTIWLLSASLVALEGCNAPSPPGSRETFVVLCECETRSERETIAAAVEEAGGDIVYVYDGIPGLSVASPPSGDRNIFMNAIRAIPGVREVAPARDAELHQRER